MFDPSKATTTIDLMSLVQITGLASVGAYLIFRDLDERLAEQVGAAEAKERLVKIRECLPRVIKTMIDPTKDPSPEDFLRFYEAVEVASAFAELGRLLAVTLAQASGVKIPPEFDPSKDENVRPDPFERGEM